MKANYYNLKCKEHYSLLIDIFMPVSTPGKDRHYLSI